jgi:hypothetical protein
LIAKDYTEFMSLLIDPKDAFVHLVYDYRCLVRAQYAYRESDKDKSINSKLPEIGTVARNAVLSKARSLVDFYTKANPWDTDITFKEYFGGTVSITLHTRLEDIKASMEVHDLHLTAWRDPVYRSTHSDPKRQRIEWNTEQASIVNDLVAALKQVARSLDGSWEKAFNNLHHTCVRVLSSGGNWEHDLNQENIAGYLSGLGL